MVSVIVGRQLAAAAGQMGAAQGQRSRKSGEMQGRFAFVMVTTLERLLLNSTSAGAGQRPGAMQLLVIERNLFVDPRRPVRRGARPARPQPHPRRPPRARRRDPDRGPPVNVILDGEMFEADDDRPIVLRPTAPVPFLRLAA